MLGLAPFPGGGAELVALTDWYRGGAETYIMDFTVGQAGEIRRFLLKACVALGDFSGTAGIVEQWLGRREVLSANRVAVSQVHGVHSSTLLEEWIPYGIGEALSASGNRKGRTQSLLLQLGYLAGVLTREGFPAISLNDLRSRGRDVVVIDVGEDLGPPGVAGTDHLAILEQALSLAEQSAPMAGRDSAALLRGFDCGRAPSRSS